LFTLSFKQANQTNVCFQCSKSDHTNPSGVGYQLGTRELGHIHGDHLLDIPFPKKVRDEIVNAGLAEPHHILPETGWVSFYLQKEGDIQKAIELLRRSYDIAVKQKQPR